MLGDGDEGDLAGLDHAQALPGELLEVDGVPELRDPRLQGVVLLLELDGLLMEVGQLRAAG